MIGTSVTRVKLCGLRDIDDAHAAVVAGADRLGFVLAPSPRRVDPRQVARIVEMTGHEDCVAVVVDVDDTSVAAVHHSAVRAVQLARDATPERCARLRKATGLPVIAVHHVDGELDATVLEQLLDAADEVLLDAASATGGGAGRMFDHRLLDQLGALVGRLGVAGGLDAMSVGRLVACHSPAFVDVSSGIEKAGRKDPDMMRKFVAAVRAASVREGEVPVR